jgi:hypothetical protein
MLGNLGHIIHNHLINKLNKISKFGSFGCQIYSQTGSLFKENFSYKNLGRQVLYHPLEKLVPDNKLLESVSKLGVNTILNPTLSGINLATIDTLTIISSDNIGVLKYFLDFNIIHWDTKVSPLYWVIFTGELKSDDIAYLSVLYFDQNGNYSENEGTITDESDTLVPNVTKFTASKFIINDVDYDIALLMEIFPNILFFEFPLFDTTDIMFVYERFPNMKFLINDVSRTNLVI